MDLLNRQAVHFVAQDLLFFAAGSPCLGLEPGRRFRRDLEALQVDEVETHSVKTPREYVVSEDRRSPLEISTAELSDDLFAEVVGKLFEVLDAWRGNVASRDFLQGPI